MIILKRKRIIFVLSCAIVSILGISLLKLGEHKNTVETVALPVSNRVIVLDAGHGVPDERGSK